MSNILHDPRESRYSLPAQKRESFRNWFAARFFEMRPMMLTRERLAREQARQALAARSVNAATGSTLYLPEKTLVTPSQDVSRSTLVVHSAEARARVQAAAAETEAYLTVEQRIAEEAAVAEHIQATEQSTRDARTLGASGSSW